MARVKTSLDVKLDVADGAERRGPTSSGAADWGERPGWLPVLQWVTAAVDGAERRGPTSSGAADWGERPEWLPVLQWVERVR